MNTKFQDRWPENVRGKFYVDQTCLDCQLCVEIAPGHFSHNDAGGYYYVSRQPASQAETDLVLEAVEGCPCESISGDGDLFDWTSGEPIVRDTIEERKEKIEKKQCSHCSGKSKAWWKFWK
jgi:ferredoxin